MYKVYPVSVQPWLVDCKIPAFVQSWFDTGILEILIASVGNMLVISIGVTLETGVVPTQYIVIISTVRRHSKVRIEHWIDVVRLLISAWIIIYERSIIKIINVTNFPKKTVMHYLFLHCCLLWKLYSNYYFIYKVAICNWWSQTLPHGLHIKKVFTRSEIHLIGA